ncbi:acyl-CoA dehydrogenase [Mumia zhuanghuii]|uniref:Dibenzothiophene monooxygenase n=2 Tax=Mumia TaxID=1546255 RepID=A0ABW1QNQ3_9ACTN|nr:MULTISPECIES: acyl-CoA dehydrogenase family protein [Mumia]KAA1420484.1 acyl-CoA dehydrogenase [Mumia zhuanghuii]
MSATLTAEYLFPDLTPDERERAARVESILPTIRDAAADADARGELPPGHIKLLADAGLLGLVVPREYGGLGGGLRDLVATTYALGTVCGSTALAYFFHCSASSRGLLPLAAIEEGLFADDEVDEVRTFAERVLFMMGRDKLCLANFASESAKASNANVLISTTATRTEGGWLLDGEKSFGCLSGTADFYLVTARRADIDGVEGLSLFLVSRDQEGVRPRHQWQGLGMRASDNNGLVMESAFVPDDHALVVPGGFARSTQMSRGSWVGNQVAITAIYAGIARGAWEYAFERTMKAKFADTGKPIASSPMHQVFIGRGQERLTDVHLWLRRQTDLEAAEVPILPKAQVVQSWKLAKGTICDGAFDVATIAMKMCGTSGALMDNVIGRAMRDTAMGLVQAFPSERGQLDLARMLVEDESWVGLTTPAAAAAAAAAAKA